MKQQEHTHPNDRKQDAFQRLLYELYTCGPLRLVVENGHPDLVNQEARLCCRHDPFLEVIDVMEQRELVSALKDGQDERVFILTDKGCLTAMMFSQRKRSQENCQCQRCNLAFVDFVRLLLKHERFQLINEDGHPHILFEKDDLCCKQKPYFYVLCKLEQQGCVEISESFYGRITDRGKRSAHLILQTGSNDFSSSAYLN